MSSVVSELYLKGLQDRIAEGDAREKEKVGVLRGGNSGIITPEGRVIGACPRLAYLRYKGYNLSDIEPMRHLMFAAGLSNEDIWVDVLKRSWDGPILTEEDVPTKWETENGIAVTGRPDIVLCDFVSGIDGPRTSHEPKLGLELKLISSLWTARNVLIEDMPKYNHVIQAAHYSWQLGIPFELWYTCRADYAVGGSDWEKRLFSKGKDLESVELNDKGNIKKITQFIRGFKLDWQQDGKLVVTSVETGKQYDTLVTAANIERFYNTVACMDDTNQLPPPPHEIKLDGKNTYPHHKYCPICKHRDKFKTVSEMIDVAKELTSGR
jgi:hypothetical protein